MASAVLVEDDQCGDNAGDPSGTGEKQYDKDGAATFVQDGKRRENDSQEYSPE